MFMNLLVMTLLSANIATAHENLMIECRSKNVADAGYIVRIFKSKDAYSALVYEETFAGKGQEYFNGDVILQTSNDKNIANLKLTSQKKLENNKIEIVLSRCGESHIVKLPKIAQHPTANMFFKLNCVFEPTLFSNGQCDGLQFHRNE